MKFEVLAKTCLDKTCRHYLLFMKISSNNIFYPRALQTSNVFHWCQLFSTQRLHTCLKVLNVSLSIFCVSYNFFWLMFSWLIIAYGNKDLKTKSLGLPYTIVLEHFQFLRNAIENSFPVLVRKDVHQVLLQFVSLDQDISCTNTGCFTFCYDRFYSRNQRKYLELMENI